MQTSFIFHIVHRVSTWFVAWMTFTLSITAFAAITVVDDAGKTVTLQNPAKRILSLAPHLTELLFAAGAGDAIVGTVEYSDYPEAAKRIPRIGSHDSLDLERIVAARPDLILVWRNGNAQKQLDKLLSLGIPAYYNQPDKLDDVARSIETFGHLAGTEAQADTAAGEFRRRIAAARARYAGRPPVTLFYQIWSKPLTTLNGTHLVADVISLCGGKSLFANLQPIAPTVAQEAVIEADPEAIISTTMVSGTLDMWRKWPRMRAVKNGNLFNMDGNLINRHAPRIADGAEKLCEILEMARRQRGVSG
jgi:iron complex transport system substrate-binding protein